jgi:benzoate-CoA ligase
MEYTPPEQFNIADDYLDARITEGRGERTAIRTREGEWSYREVQALANRYGNLLRASGVKTEQRVIIALPDGPDFVAALFGILKIGAVVVMLNPELKADAIRYMLDYSRASVVLAHRDTLAEFESAAQGAEHLEKLLVVASEEFDAGLSAASPEIRNFSSHRDDAAIWLFSGGTTGQPKAVVQTHTSFANTTECYAKGVLGFKEDDVTLSVPKLYFGYATGSNLLFPFSVGATVALFPERCTADYLFEMIERFKPTVLINVPTMIKKLLEADEATSRDLSCLRIATSAGEALPPDLHRRWAEAYGVDLLDGLGTAEMWHIFISNRPGDIHPGTLGRVVPGFEVKICDDDGREVLEGETGLLWVRGNSLAIGYWEQIEKTKAAFRGQWFVSEDMLSKDADGVFTYRGRSDDMLKVSGKWLATREVEECLQLHTAVQEAAVVGVEEADGLTKPHAFVVVKEGAGGSTLVEELQAFVREHLDAYKYPRQVFFLEDLPRTHLGKIARGKLREIGEAGNTSEGAGL